MTVILCKVGPFHPFTCESDNVQAAQTIPLGRDAQTANRIRE